MDRGEEDDEEMFFVKQCEIFGLRRDLEFLWD